ncbi:dentin sialophosphoprotein-like isoform X2 [Saccostrea echinata]|uniref:dentin sialophosphoprotein-like isoform X2 n=1 Tax=Saccostrea echinata TaxID=191078 RepID=UPI002A821D29|nr:dentin sialophosphoprotein-like isoform X2 [Saccostrea echinata]
MRSPLFAVCFCLYSLYVSGAPVEIKAKPTSGERGTYTEQQNKSSDEQSPSQVIIGDEVREEEKENAEEESLNSLLRTVLITLRDHPDIVMDILQDEERKNMDFQRPPEQLDMEPKRVQKKGGEMYKALGDSSESSDSSDESRENSDSRDASYYKNKYDKSSKSSQDSEESRELDLAHYYKQKYRKSEDDDTGSSVSNDEDDREENKKSTVPLDKRVPEQPEETIDITSLPDGNDVDLTDMISEGGLEDLPEYIEWKNKLPKPSKLLTSDGSLNLGKIAPGFIQTSTKLEEQNTQPRSKALKPVVTEAQMSQNSGKVDKGSYTENKSETNQTNEKSSIDKSKDS